MHRCRIREPPVGYRGMLSLEMFKFGLSDTKYNLLHSLYRKWLTGKFFLRHYKKKIKYLICILGKINFLRFLDRVPATLRCRWNSSILFNKFSFEEHVLILKCFSWAEWFFPWGVFLGILRGGVRPDSPNSHIVSYFLFNWKQLTNMFIHSRSSLENCTRFQTKMGKVYTRFQTKTTQNPYPLGRHIPISWLI